MSKTIGGFTLSDIRTALDDQLTDNPDLAEGIIIKALEKSLKANKGVFEEDMAKLKKVIFDRRLKVRADASNAELDQGMEEEDAGSAAEEGSDDDMEQESSEEANNKGKKIQKKDDADKENEDTEDGGNGKKKKKNSKGDEENTKKRKRIDPEEADLDFLEGDELIPAGKRSRALAPTQPKKKKKKLTAAELKDLEAIKNMKRIISYCGLPGLKGYSVKTHTYAQIKRALSEYMKEHKIHSRMSYSAMQAYKREYERVLERGDLNTKRKIDPDQRTTRATKKINYTDVEDPDVDVFKPKAPPKPKKKTKKKKVEGEEGAEGEKAEGEEGEDQESSSSEKAPPPPPAVPVKYGPVHRPYCNLHVQIPNTDEDAGSEDEEWIDVIIVRQSTSDAKKWWVKHSNSARRECVPFVRGRWRTVAEDSFESEEEQGSEESSS